MSVLETLLRQIAVLKETDHAKLLALAQEMATHGEATDGQPAQEAPSHAALRHQGLLEGPPLAQEGRQQLGGRFKDWHSDLSATDFADARREAWAGLTFSVPSCA